MADRRLAPPPEIPPVAPSPPPDPPPPLPARPEPLVLPAPPEVHEENLAAELTVAGFRSVVVAHIGSAVVVSGVDGAGQPLLARHAPDLAPIVEAHTGEPTSEQAQQAQDREGATLPPGLVTAAREGRPFTNPEIQQILRAVVLNQAAESPRPTPQAPRRIR